MGRKPWGCWAARVGIAIGVTLPATAAPAAAQDVTGTITIVKKAVPRQYQDFRFTTGGDFGPEFPHSFILDDDNLPPRSNTQVFAGLGPGTYVITEVGAEGWRLAEVDCGGSAAASRNGSTVTITITGQSESVTCTFVNEKVPAGTVEPPPPKTDVPAGPPAESPAPMATGGPGQPQEGSAPVVQGEALPVADTPAAVEQAAGDLEALPRTGAPAGGPALAGAALVAAGSLVLAAGRWRSRRRDGAAPHGASG